MYILAISEVVQKVMDIPDPYTEFDKLSQKYAINKESTIFTQFLWHFVKIPDTWVGHFSKVS